ncbi:MAG: LacI family transcriptional regulator [Actinomycetales bacterium]|nr:LacI family transcriptional regulator [Actinomycetales bacterium]
MSITIRDVAQAAGVSTATVSRALRGLPHVDPETRERVRRVAQEMDYVVSPSASRLASGRTGTVAVITPFIDRWFFSTVLSGISDVLQAREVDLIVFEVGDPSTSPGLPTERRLRGRADGMIVVTLPTDAPRIADLLEIGLPASFIGATWPGVPSVCIDDAAAARTATQHLINLGHQRIGIISGRPQASTSQGNRSLGYREAMTGAGLKVDPALEAHGYFTVAGGEAAMTALLSQPHPPTAVFAMSDDMAFGAIRSLQRHGIRPGSDIAIASIDGHDLAELLDVTTVGQPVAEMGRMAAEALLARMLGSEADRSRDVVVPTTLVVRGSTVPVERTATFG